MTIRTGKILLAALILVIGLQESLSMWRQIGDVTSVAVSVFINLLLAGLLLRSALKRGDPLVPPSRGWTIFWNVIGVLCALSLIGNLFGLGKPPVKHAITVNGLTIPLDKCVQGAVRVFKEPSERVKWCECTATKLANIPEVAATHKQDIESGRMDEVIEKLLRDQQFDMSGFADCLTNTEGTRWTTVMIERVKNDCITRMNADSSDVEYDAVGFCECLSSKLSGFPPSVVASWQSDTVAELSKMRLECGEKSRK